MKKLFIPMALFGAGALSIATTFSSAEQSQKTLKWPHLEVGQHVQHQPGSSSGMHIIILNNDEVKELERARSDPERIVSGPEKVIEVGSDYIVLDLANGWKRTVFYPCDRNNFY